MEPQREVKELAIGSAKTALLVFSPTIKYHRCSRIFGDVQMVNSKEGRDCGEESRAAGRGVLHYSPFAVCLIIE